jgi:hypothetical protein
MDYNLTHKTHGQLGELAETTPLLRVRTFTGTEGSNPSLSASKARNYGKFKPFNFNTLPKMKLIIDVMFL